MGLKMVLLGYLGLGDVGGNIHLMSILALYAAQPRTAAQLAIEFAFQQVDCAGEVLIVDSYHLIGATNFDLALCVIRSVLMGIVLPKLYSDANDVVFMVKEFFHFLMDLLFEFGSQVYVYA